MSNPETTSFIEADVTPFKWLVIVSGFACFAMAWGIGANDVANCFGTSVGAKAITLKQAVVIASIFEFLGAVVLGAGVTNTIRSGITDFSQFEGEEDLLMLGMFAALVSAAMWLFLATKYSLPVSTTQSIVGSIIGFTLVEKGTDAIHWENVYEIIIWWFATPIAAGLIVVVLFLPIRNWILRRTDSYQTTLRMWPFLVFLVIAIMTTFLLEKGVQSINVDLSDVAIIGIACGVGIICALIAYFGFVQTGLVHRFVQRRCKEKLLKCEEMNEQSSEMAIAGNGHQSNEQAKDYQIIRSNQANGQTTTGYGALADESDAFEDGNEAQSEQRPQTDSLVHTLEEKTHGLKDQLMYGMNVDIEQDLTEQEEGMKNNKEQFDEHSEEAFAWLQVLTASFAILAHGSNDVANAIAPFAAIIGIFETGGVSSTVPVKTWVVALGGVGMSIGLATYGYKIIKCLGCRMAAMSCSRGYCIQLSSATTIILASYFAQPASSTHAQVGATVGCGLLELANPDSKLSLKEVINWKLLMQTFFGWVMTLIISGLTSAAIFALFAYSPSARIVCDAQP
mmetsp:Transcript_32881/g.52661  ORF Transcript_32881/g.52661 Transcript_32881/m.52661 type:complete len:565 (+) Transcript_32881:80-1774(+)